MKEESEINKKEETLNKWIDRWTKWLRLTNDIQFYFKKTFSLWCKTEI